MSERARDFAGNIVWTEAGIRALIQEELTKQSTEPPVEPYNPPYVLTQERFEEVFGVELEDWRWRIIEYYITNNGGPRPDGICPHFREAWQTDALWAAHLSNCEG